MNTKAMRNKLMEQVRQVYHRMKNGMSLEEAREHLDNYTPPIVGYSDKRRQQTRAKNYRSRASRRVNRLRAKHARV